jgi:hypothetical protein
MGFHNSQAKIKQYVSFTILTNNIKPTTKIESQNWKSLQNIKNPESKTK